ncbi:MAG TPA: peptidylprolyl isomerase [Terriglobales bacterium]|jgi:peptidyl-prolyl cis-trans isomerase A (cyclophilin A)|nr:peptidylprolyl isomerase [Terriglobales bacterium]
MRTVLHIFFLIISTSLLGVAQAASTAPSSTTPPVHKAAPAPAAEPVAIIHTTAGDLHCTLFPKVAPIGVANFIGLANGSRDWTSPIGQVKKHGVPLYDGTIFHRVIPEFMIQGGDPAGNGTGDPGYKFKNETSPAVTFDRPGRLAYANAGPDTNGSQFFITEVPYPSLNGGYTIFGQCDDAAVELVKKIARMATDGERPLRPIKINHIEIHHRTALTAKPAPKPSASANNPTS